MHVKSCTLPKFVRFLTTVYLFLNTFLSHKTSTAAIYTITQHRYSDQQSPSFTNTSLEGFLCFLSFFLSFLLFCFLCIKFQPFLLLNVLCLFTFSVSWTMTLVWALFPLTVTSLHFPAQEWEKKCYFSDIFRLDFYNSWSLALLARRLMMKVSAR